MRNEKPKIILNIRVQDELREKFRIKTIKEKTTMSAIITKAIEEYLEK